MRLIRYQTKKDAVRYGWILDDPAGNLVGPLEGVPYAGFRRLEADLPLEQVKLLAPILPSKMICVGRNYVEHAREHGVDVPEIPLIFLKPPSCVLDPDGTILLLPQIDSPHNMSRRGYRKTQTEGILLHCPTEEIDRLVEVTYIHSQHSRIKEHPFIPRSQFQSAAE